MTCRAMYEQVGKPTPCYTTCGKPEKILPYNAPFIYLYEYCSDQLRTGMDGAFALDMNAVEIAMDHHFVPMEERVEFYTRLRIISATILRLQRDEAAAKRAQQTKKR